MVRRCTLPGILTWIVLGMTAPLPAQDEPTFLDRKLSDWLTQLESGKDGKARRRGVLAVEQIGHAGSRKVVPALTKALREDTDPAVRTAAARAAGRTMARALEQARSDKKDDLPRFDATRDALAAALRTDRSEAVREAAALALGDLGPDARAATGALALALEDKHVPTVRAAAAALRRIGSEAGDAREALQRLLATREGDAEARADAALSLGQIRFDPAVLPVLRAALTDASADARVRRAAAETLGKLGKESGDAAGDLGKVLTARETSADLRLAAATALEQIGTEGKAAIPALLLAISDAAQVRQMGEHARVIRCLAMHALGRLGKDLAERRKDTVAALLRATEDPNVEVCVTAIETLAALTAEGQAADSDAVVQKLDAILQREGRKAIREAAEAARERLRPKKEKP